MNALTFYLNLTLIILLLTLYYLCCFSQQQIFNTFMHTEYGGPGTLLVLPFIDMSDAINERGLPGGPQAARAAVKWAQDHVDKDWNQWTGDDAT